MRIAYLTFEVPSPDTGVGRKIAAQANAWRQEGHDVRHLVLRPGDGTCAEHVVRPARARIGPPMLAASLSSGIIGRELHRYRPDLVYMRQMIWWPGLASVLQGHTIVDEVNSDLRAELTRARGTGTKIKRLLHAGMGWSVERRLAGRVHVTHELMARCQLPGARNVVISNGYEFGEVPADRPSASRPQLIMVCSSDQPWQGVDLLAAAARRLPDMDFHLVGPLSTQPSENLHLHGPLRATALASLYAAMDFGIGPLAMFRKSMDEACSLKVREYVNFGLPVISGQRDTDLSGTAFYLQLDGAVTRPQRMAELMRAFVRRWRGASFPHEQARGLLSVATKERQRLAFFDEILAHVEA